MVPKLLPFQLKCQHRKKRSAADGVRFWCNPGVHNCSLTSAIERGINNLKFMFEV